MRIALVANSSWNIYNFRGELIKSLSEQGADIHIIAPRDKYSREFIRAGYHYYAIKMDGNSVNPFNELLSIAELFKLYKEIRPDIVLHFTIKPNIYGALAAWLLKIPVINTICGLGTVFLNNSYTSKIAMLLYYLIFRYPRKIMFHNDEDRKLFVSKGLVKEEKTEVIPGSGVNLQKFKPGEKPSNQEFTFIMISRMIRDKGVVEYVEAAKILRKRNFKARFLLMGTKQQDHKRGISEELIDSWIKEGSIEYLGATDDVRPFIDQADCVVLPSYREGASRILLEGAAMAKPLIASDTPGCNNIVTDQVNGFLCNVRDSEDLSKKMLKMLNLSQDRLRMIGDKGRSKVEAEFSDLIVSERYLNNIREIAEPVNLIDKELGVTVCGL